jgi:hypothetical protein
MKDRTLEELRKNMVSTVESLSLEMGGSSYPGSTMESERKDAEDVVAEFESAVRKDECARIRKNWMQRGFENKSPDDDTVYRNIDEDSLFGINLAP